MSPQASCPELIAGRLFLSLLSLTYHFILYESGYIVTLAACSLALGPWFVEAWRLELLAVDPDPRAKLLPAVTHNLELSCDGLQLWPGRVANFYCEFFSQVAPCIGWENVLRTSPDPSVLCCIL